MGNFIDLEDLLNPRSYTPVGKIFYPIVFVIAGLLILKKRYF